jgi:hypothetical protein
MWFYFKLQWYDEVAESSGKVADGLVWAGDFMDAMQCLHDDYGDDIEAVYLTPCGDGMRTFTSKEISQVLPQSRHDLNELAKESQED